MSSNLTQAQIDHYLSLSEEEWKIALSSLDTAAKLLLYEAKYQKLAAISQQKDQQLAAKDQQLSVKDQQISAKDEQLSAKDQLLNVKDQQLSAKDQLLILKEQEIAKEKELARQMTAEHQEKTKPQEMKNGLTTGSATVRCDFIDSNIAKSDLLWPGPPDNLIELCWKLCRNSPLVTDPSSHRDEDSDTHPPILAAIQIITETSKRLFSTNSRCTTLHNPRLIPDIVMGNYGIQNFNWGDVVALVELKKPTVPLLEAVAQSAEYLVYAIDNMPESERYRVAIASNYISISFLHIDSNRIIDIKRTDGYDLFPANWKQLDEPTEGFKRLVHALMLPFPVIKNFHVTNLTTGLGYQALVTGTLYHTHDCGVYNVEIGGTSLALKIAKGKWSIAGNEIEIRNYRAISSIREMRKYIIPHLMDEYYVKNGFIMDAAQPFLYWIEDKRQEMNESPKNIPSQQMDELVGERLLVALKALECLHKNGWRHGDIRPGNFVLFQDSVRLIDWVTAARLERKADTLFKQGHTDPFWPDDAEIVKVGEKWDLIGFGYTCIYFGSSFFEKNEMANPNQRRALVKKLLLDHTNRLARVGALIVECVEQKHIWKYDYFELARFFSALSIATTSNKRISP